ncbi:hypothetical protein DL767_009398 [Monosporascus sp. MG133]|nr:hypothetical protein DL767_009398 [Monosporascus sp. MG133]
MSSQEELRQLSRPEYWDEKYTDAAEDAQLHEWFRTFDELKPFLDKNLFQIRRPETNPRILHLGSGDSTVPYDLFELGYKNQLCVDFSPVIVDRMTRRHSKAIKEGGMEWRWMDVRDMSEIPSGSIDVAFDKGTLDAMIHGTPWTIPDEVQENTGRYVRETLRVLKPNGYFLLITHRPVHWYSRVLDLHCKDTEWKMRYELLNEGGGVVQYHGYILQRG